MTVIPYNIINVTYKRKIEEQDFCKFRAAQSVSSPFVLRQMVRVKQTG